MGITPSKAAIRLLTWIVLGAGLKLGGGKIWDFGLEPQIEKLNEIKWWEWIDDKINDNLDYATLENIKKIL